MSKFRKPRCTFGILHLNENTSIILGGFTVARLGVQIRVVRTREPSMATTVVNLAMHPRRLEGVVVPGVSVLAYGVVRYAVTPLDTFEVTQGASILGEIGGAHDGHFGKMNLLQATTVLLVATLELYPTVGVAAELEVAASGLNLTALYDAALFDTFNDVIH